ncbi:UvrD-helicase domain-containing protein [Halanaerobiaceae bacterium Z-7014]|uniref:ATP-dependent DNA helicase PcrA n=1 Tax=Halonatronomonas betaini TaxID=2778430 RepID=A0A931ASE1_9FIRM|nr:UvrD-helicase domain-containing protein [Halonatronomonas betaini]MBF8438097.1 UvrD-helicase domain-containing protein [Halonatronomonas betaini]
MNSTENQILAGLNQPQKEAVMHFKGPALVLAGAGSGKTRVLTRRIAYLIAEYGVNPGNILAMTFTNKAASEMKERVNKLISEEMRSWVGTFHSFGATLLRREAEKLGFKRNFSIYDTSDQKRMIKEIMQDLNIDTKKTKPSRVLNEISDAKNQLIRPEDYKVEKFNFLSELVSKIYPTYQQRMKESNAFDFDDLIMKPCQLFTEYPRIKEYYNEKYKYILVDEYQDVNHAQYRLSQLLTGIDNNIFVVGDPDQSIYGFRGADINNILNFEKDFADAKVIRLEQNYRSKENILKAAQSVIKNNSSRLDKDLWSDRGEGDSIEFFEAATDKEEAGFIMEEAKKLNRAGEYNYGDMVVLYRTNAQSRSIEDVLRRNQVPYQIVGGLKFYDRKEIKDIVAYLRLINNPADTAALLRIINEPARGIGAKTIERVQDYAYANNISLFQSCLESDHNPELTKAYSSRVIEFAELIEEFQELENEITIDKLVSKILSKTGYESEIISKEGPKAQERLENIGELQSAMREYLQENDDGSLAGFLEEVALIADIDTMEDKNNFITLMTLHSAKGLEFPVVFLAGLDEGLFPHGNSMDDASEIEEERRLCYVGITRAQDKLYILRAKNRFRYGESKYYAPSRFLNEIPDSLINCEDDEDYGTIDIKDKSNNSSINARSSNYKEGQKIIHPSWGIGEIKQVKEDRGTKLTIRFKDGKERELLAEYAPLQPVRR